MVHEGKICYDKVHVGGPVGDVPVALSGQVD